MVKGLQGAIVAAGRGERLRTSTAGLPKPLVELAGRPLLVRQASALMDAGAAEVLAVVNSETAGLIENRATRLPAGLRLVVRDTANSMESLFVLGESLRPGRFLLATVDALIPRPELTRFVETACDLTREDSRSSLDGVLATVRWRGDQRPLFARVDAKGLITELGDSVARVVTAGAYVLSTRVFAFKAMAHAGGLGSMRRFLALLISEGLHLGAIEVSGAIDIDEASDLEAARAVLKGGR